MHDDQARVDRLRAADAPIALVPNDPRWPERFEAERALLGAELQPWLTGTHHLHVVEHRGTAWRQRLALRDALRQDATLAERYAQLKRSLAARHLLDREACTQAKAPFIASVLQSWRRVRAAES